MDKKLNIQFIGYGNMGSSLGEIIIDKSQELGLSLNLSVQTRHKNIVSTDADIVFACAKPKDINTISLDIYNSDAVCVSIMNGITTDKLGYFNNIIRTMPNLLGEVGEGITAWYEKGQIQEGLKQFIQSIFVQSGIIIQMNNEIDFSAFTAFAGCGPAIVAYIEQYCSNDIYRAYVYEYMQQIGKKLGFTQEQSSVIVQKLRHGLPKYLNKHGITYEDMIQRVSAGDSSSSTYHIIDFFNTHHLNDLLQQENGDMKKVLYAGILTGKVQSDTLTKQYSA